MVRFPISFRILVKVISLLSDYLVNTFHMFSSARIIYLVNTFNLRLSPIPTHLWCFMKCILCNCIEHDLLVAMENIQQLLSYLSLDQLVVCAFYAICRVHGINVTFQNLLDVYTCYLQPMQSNLALLQWGSIQELWFNIDLSFLENVCLSFAYRL